MRRASTAAALVAALAAVTGSSSASESVAPQVIELEAVGNAATPRIALSISPARPHPSGYLQSTIRLVSRPAEPLYFVQQGAIHLGTPGRSAGLTGLGRVLQGTPVVWVYAITTLRRMRARGAYISAWLRRNTTSLPLNMRGRIDVERLAGRVRTVALAAGPTTHDHFSATLDAAQAVPRPRGVRPGARGHLSGTVTSVFPGAYMWPGRASFRLIWSSLTGAPTDIVIRFGRRGRTGHVWHRLCSRHAGRGGCPQRRSGTIRGTFSLPGGPSDLRTHELYVEIATDRNPRGELRGQIEP